MTAHLYGRPGKYTLQIHEGISGRCVEIFRVASKQEARAICHENNWQPWNF
jgi:hypothetical protein